MSPADVVAKPAGQPPARLDMRASDVRTYRIDCSALLRQHELLVRVESVDVSGVSVEGARARGGTMIEAQFMPGLMPNPRSFLELPLTFLVRTTQGLLTVVITVRVVR